MPETVAEAIRLLDNSLSQILAEVGHWPHRHTYPIEALAVEHRAAAIIALHERYPEGPR